MRQVKHFWYQLISPTTILSDPNQYRQARLLATLSIIAILAAIVVQFMIAPSYSSDQMVRSLPTLAGIFLFSLPYHYSRKGQIKIASLMICAIAIASIGSGAIIIGGEVGQQILHYFVFVPLFATVFLNSGYATVFFIISSLMIILFNVNSPTLELVQIMRGPLVFNAVGSILVILIASFWKRYESEKLQLLQESEQQKAQLLLKREQYDILGTFVESISHDLRTRLSLIETNRFFVRRMLETDESNEKLTRRLDDIQDIVSDIDHQISNLNLVVNLDDPIYQTIDLNQIVNEVYQQKQLTAEYQIKALIKETATTSLITRCNPSHIQAALEHLIDNALAHSDSMDTVTISTNRDDKWVMVHVKDEGSGISPEHLDHIFDIFYKTDKARTTSQAGLGLGLTIVKLIAETYSGEVSVCSTLGEGSTLTIRLPLHQSSDQNPSNRKNTTDK